MYLRVSVNRVGRWPSWAMAAGVSASEGLLDRPAPPIPSAESIFRSSG